VVRAQAVSRFVALVFVGWLLVCAGGCDSLSEFKGTFSGAVVQGSFVRSCFAAETSAKLRFFPSAAVVRSTDMKDEERNWLTLTNKEDDSIVFDAALDPIEALSSDTLADFDFPGQKRLRNFMLLGRSEVGPLAGRDALVVVSLLADKHVEVRVIGRGADDDPPCSREDADGDAGVPPARAPEYYGLFKLK
jgi:hypothetical protein